MIVRKARWLSHLFILLITILILVLGWRLSPDMGGWPNLRTEPMFQPDEFAPEHEEPVEIPSPLTSPTLEEEPAAVLISAPMASDPPVIPSIALQATVEAVADPTVMPSPSELFVDWSHARRLLRQRDLAGAEGAYQNLLQRWPEHPDLAGELGNVYVLMGETNAAREVFQRAQRQLLPLGPSIQLRAVTMWLEQHP